MDRNPCPCRGNDKNCPECKGTGVVIIIKRPIRGTR